jgi:hypothetical protein
MAPQNMAMAELLPLRQSLEIITTILLAAALVISSQACILMRH